MNRDEGNERVVFVRSAELPGTEVMVGYNCRYPFYYFHERYALTSCVSVALGVRYRDRDDYVLDRYVMVLEPGKKYFNTYVAKPAQFKVFFIDPQPLADCLRELGFPRSFHFTSAPITSDARLLPLLHQLCASIETGQGRLAQQSLFRACVRAFARHAAHKPPALEAKNGSRAVERAKAYLRERFDKSVSLHQLAIVSGLSQFHLVHKFTKYVGAPPHAFQIYLRVERARSLLQKGVAPACTAASVGFADQSHLLRHFKRILGVTPSQYSRAYRTFASSRSVTMPPASESPTLNF